MKAPGQFVCMRRHWAVQHHPLVPSHPEGVQPHLLVFLPAAERQRRLGEAGRRGAVHHRCVHMVRYGQGWGQGLPHNRDVRPNIAFLHKSCFLLTCWNPEGRFPLRSMHVSASRQLWAGVSVPSHMSPVLSALWWLMCIRLCHLSRQLCAGACVHELSVSCLVNCVGMNAHAVRHGRRGGALRRPGALQPACHAAVHPVHGAHTPPLVTGSLLCFCWQLMCTASHRS